MAELQRRKYKAVIEPEPNSVSSDDFQDFESYQSQQPSQEVLPANSTSEEMPHSSTNESLTEIQGKNFTPSLVSSGYGSQAVSMLTLSSEDSLSIRSIEDNTEGHKDSRGSQKGSVEQSSESEEDQQGISNSESEEHLTECNNTNVMEASDSDSNKTVLSQEKVETAESTDSSSVGVENSSVDNSKGAVGRAESNSLGECAMGNKPSGEVDPYSETAMEELEKLGFDEEEEMIDEKNGEGEVELFISEESDTKTATDKNRTTNKLISNKSFTPPNTLEKPRGVIKRPQRPVSCILPSEQSVIEESMKRNSLGLHLSDEDEMG